MKKLIIHFTTKIKKKLDLGAGPRFMFDIGIRKFKQFPW